jgi:hypothetical protein
MTRTALDPRLDLTLETALATPTSVDPTHGGL